jgi:hypothetical protein
MKRLTLVLALVACGGSSNHSGSDASNDGHAIDAHVIDAPADARPLDAAALDAPPDSSIVIIDAPVLDAPPATCNPLNQSGCNTGEKCTWIVDAYTPTYVGHIGCTPDGTAHNGEACQFGAAGPTGYDNCIEGMVCSDYRGGTGVCRDICDPQGGNPMCDATHGCVSYLGLFSDGTTAPSAGLCAPGCDPLADNDFDGSGSALTRTGSACGSATIGCYGYPTSSGLPTQFTCTTDINYTTSLHHRTVCDMTNGCEDPSGQLSVNSCNQGYLPLLIESTGSTNVICTAMCKPANCYSGNCGTADANQHGVAPHRCQTPDALGTFNTTAGGEECAYWWFLEVDPNTNTLNRSAYSDSLGFCLDHSKYMYDSNGDGTPDTAIPSCQSLPLTGTTTFGAVDLGCVDSATAGFFTGKHRAPLPGLRAPYHHAMR